MCGGRGRVGVSGGRVRLALVRVPLWHIHMHMCTPHKARGDKWQPHAEAGRAKYKMNSAEDFTARPHIQLRGCATQVTSRNFLHETVNIRLGSSGRSPRFRPDGRA